MNKIRISTLGMMLLCVAATATAQSKKKPLEKTITKQAARTPEIKPVEQPLPFVPIFWDAGTSPVKYLENQSANVFQWLAGRALGQVKSFPRKPDQFSTREDREQYQTAISDSVKSIQALPLRLDCKQKYDAESQSFAISILADMVVDAYMDQPVGSANSTKIDDKALKLRRLEIPGGTVVNTGVYKAQNAYGASIDVTKSTVTEYFLAVPAGISNGPNHILNLSYGSESGVSSGNYMFSVPVASVEAREVEKDIVCLGVISILPPGALYASRYIAPRRERPIEEFGSYYGIMGKLDHIIIFNKITGVVYGKVSRSDI